LGAAIQSAGAQNDSLKSRPQRTQTPSAVPAGISYRHSRHFIAKAHTTKIPDSQGLAHADIQAESLF